jgi:opacity protein-like surface antigen
MKKILFLILLPFLVCSQKHTQRIGGGLEYMVGDNWFLSPRIAYEYQVGKRVFSTSNLGLIHKNIFNEFNGVKTTIQRLMLDFDAKFAILKLGLGLLFG